MKSILLYNLFPRTIWKEVTSKLLGDAPHDSIVIHISMPWYKWPCLLFIKKYLWQIDKVDKILVSTNRKKRGESFGFDKLRKKISFEPYDVITYVHSKGTSRKRKNTQPVADWTELMRYFVIERLDLCEKAFKEGYFLYGVNLNDWVKKAPKYVGLDTGFIYEGNFVSLNNRMLANEFLAAPCYKSYYGVERFWGNICAYEKAYCVYQSKTDHYNKTYPQSIYKK